MQFDNISNIKKYAFKKYKINCEDDAIDRYYNTKKVGYEHDFEHNNFKYKLRSKTHYCNEIEIYAYDELKLIKVWVNEVEDVHAFVDIVEYTVYCYNMGNSEPIATGRYNPYTEDLEIF